MSEELSASDIAYLIENGQPIPTSLVSIPESGAVGVSITQEPALLHSPIEQPTAPSPLPSNPPVENEINLTPTRATGFDIKDPVELLFLLDDDIANGRTKLHPWQIQFMMDFSLETHVKENPFQAAVQAANGSGKDKIIVAACSVWLCMRYLQARCAVTNGSGDQLDNQTEVHIDYLCKQANKKIAPNIWKCNYRYYECLATGSPIKLFATDEPGKAEGYHPLVTGGKMGIFASEAKSIPDEIFSALARCNGYTHRVDVSSPGNIVGYFYDTCTANSISRSGLADIKVVGSTHYVHYKITAYDCPHITPQEIESFAAKLPGGKNNPVFKSGMLAEFGSTGEQVVIPTTYVWNAMHKCADIKWHKEPNNKGGLDLSDGGAENVLVVRNGNKVLGIEAFRFEDTEDTIVYLQELFVKWELTCFDAKIYGDCVGIGSPMLKSLRRKGWTNIRFFDSRNSSHEPKVYYNIITEKWFHVRSLMERQELIVCYDKELQKQLASRYYKIPQKQVHQLLSKQEQKAKGYPSPDRADALIYCFSDYKSTFTESTQEKDKPFVQPIPDKPTSEFNVKEYVKRDTNNPYNRNPSKGKDFSLLREDIQQHNRLKKQLHEQV